MGLFKYMMSSYIDKRVSMFQNETMQKHMSEVENIYRQMRGWRHDYHNHIQTMKACLYLKEYDKLDTYLNGLDSDLKSIDMVVKTGNVMVDAILNSKLSLAISNGININVKAIIPDELTISEVDLCIIVGNLLDNAMEACGKIEKEDERFLRVYIDIMKEQLYIYVSNSIKGKAKKHGGIYQSSKRSETHGLGLMRIDKIVERNQGYLNRQDEEGIFATEVMLPL